MPIIGLVLILASVVVGVVAIFEGGEPATVEVLGATVDTSVGGVFLAGAATMLLFLGGAWLFTSSLGRARRKRAERKQVKRRHRDSVASLEQERTELRAENERLSGQLGQRSGDAGAAGSDGAGAAPASSAATTGGTSAGTTRDTSTGRHSPVTEDGDTRTKEGPKPTP
jgi:hypothetical protein